MLKRLSILALILPALSGLPAQANSLPPEVREKICALFDSQGIKPGEPAPDFTLEWSRGTTINASAFWKKKPLVVISGSYSCPWFRENTPARKALIEEFGSRVNFVIVYTREAHPNDTASPYNFQPLSPAKNRQEGISVPDAKNYRERLVAARRCVETLDLDAFVVVDTMDNAVWNAYGKSPNCAYLIGTDGKVIVQQGLGDPAALRTELEKLFPR